MPQLVDFEFDVFLGYSPKDKSAVRDIAKRLRSDGLRVWFDALEMKSNEAPPQTDEACGEGGSEAEPR